jgi:CDP-diacylglycerol pyrophosphatase
VLKSRDDGTVARAVAARLLSSRSSFAMLAKRVISNVTTNQQYAIAIQPSSMRTRLSFVEQT